MRVASLLLFLPIAACSGTGVGTGAGSSGSSGSSSTSSTSGSGGVSTSGGTDTNTPTTDTSDYDALFDAPTSTTTTDGLVTGLWAGTYGQYDDVRIQLSGSNVRIAIRCFGVSPGTGLDVPAVVTSTGIKILASKSVRQASQSCSISVAPEEIPACSSSSSDFGCFNLSGTSLEFVGASLFTTSDSSDTSGHFLKLSD